MSTSLRRLNGILDNTSERINADLDRYIPKCLQVESRVFIDTYRVEFNLSEEPSYHIRVNYDNNVIRVKLDNDILENNYKLCETINKLLVQLKDYLEERDVLYHSYMNNPTLALMNLTSDTDMKKQAAEKALGKGKGY